MRTYNRTAKFITFLLLSLVLFTSCSSYVNLNSTQAYFKRADFPLAYQNLQLQAPNLLKAQGPIIMNYDMGVLARLTSQYTDSNNYLSNSERLIQEAYTESITANIASFLVNDNTKEYQGEDYEDMYLNVFKALNYLHMGDTEGALVELNRSIEKQAFLKQKYEQYEDRVYAYANDNGLDTSSGTTYATSFATSALSNYLSAAVAQALGEANTVHYASNQVRHAFDSQPGLYPFPLPSEASLEEQAFPTDKGRVQIVSFSGQAPVKQQRVERVHVSAFNFAKIAYPVLVGIPSRIQAVRITISNGKSFKLERIESISNVAIDTFKAKSELIRLKAVVRSMAKAVGVAAYDAYTQKDNEVTFAEELLGMIFRIANDVSEQADIRSTHFLPAEAWVGYIDLPQGNYDITYEFLNVSGKTIYTTSEDLAVRNGQLTLAEAYCPL